MSQFEFHQCTSPGCGLRIPLDLDQYSGQFCPRCGAPLEKIIPSLSGDLDEASTQPVRRISTLLDNIRSAHNVGAIFRTADGAGVKELYLCGFTPTPDDTSAIAKTALGAEEHVPWTQHRNALVLADDLRAKGARLIALERLPKATPIYRFRVEPRDKRPWVLVVGNERAGVDPGLLERCDDVVALPMAGEKTSLNVAVAFGAAAYWLCFARSAPPEDRHTKMENKR
ncbi:MAG: TrmH family RNA methyltransferase [Chloroflexota bacterium]|nr:TrmH family RNA methyltransferase [Chloroflexota bacterium]